MAIPRFSRSAVGPIRRAFDAGSAGGLSDRELLDRFASRGGEAAESAFAALVERHGPMVLRACRSTLRDPHDAQDAFQSTFLLLARRAGSLWVRDSIGPWLHSVACRVSAGARTARARRRALERRAAGSPVIGPDDPTRDDLGPALHEEVERLPERLRAPVVLCYLEGLTHEQAAEQLACPVGTVRSRLSRGRDRIRRALTRRGLAPSTTLPGAVGPPALPAALATLTTRAAARLASDRVPVGPVARWLASLTEGWLRPMALHPWKSAAVLLLSAGTVAVGLGARAGQEPAEAPTRPVAIADQTGTGAPIERRLEAMETRFEAMKEEARSLRLRVDELGRKLEAIGGSKTATRAAGLDPDTITKIRPRFNNSLVQRVFVTSGSPVKKGDPLFEFQSSDLAVARNDCRTRFVQWDHDHKFLIAREPLAKAGRITQLVWTDTQNDEKKSRLDYLIARERLMSLGMSAEEVDRLLEALDDDRMKPPLANPNFQDISRMTVVSPVDGVVLERDVVPGNFYDTRDVLLIIAPPTNVAPARR